MNQPRVRWNGVAFLYEDDIAGHELSCGQGLVLAAAHYAGLCRRHLPQGRHRFLCLRFLDIAHEGVKKHDGKNGDGLIGQGRVALIQPQSG